MSFYHFKNIVYMESFMHGDIPVGKKYFIKKCYYIQQYFKLNGSLLINVQAQFTSKKNYLVHECSLKFLKDLNCKIFGNHITFIGTNFAGWIKFKKQTTLETC